MALKYAHPLSSVALSECGNYFCVGNLKGEVISYDLRNTKSYLNAQKVHNSAVNRISFVPSTTKILERRASILSEGKPELAENNGFKDRDVRESFANIENFHRRDSFFDFLDNNQRAVDLPTPVSKFRESFDWETLEKTQDGRPSSRLSDKNITDRHGRLSNNSKENIPEGSAQRRMSKDKVPRLKNISEENEEINKSMELGKQVLNTTKKLFMKTKSGGSILDGKTSTPHIRRFSDDQALSSINISTIARTTKSE